MLLEFLQKQMIRWIPKDNRKRGRLKISWLQQIEKAMSERTLEPGDVSQPTSWTNWYRNI